MMLRPMATGCSARATVKGTSSDKRIAVHMKKKLPPGSFFASIFILYFVYIPSPVEPSQITGTEFFYSCCPLSFFHRLEHDAQLIQLLLLHGGGSVDHHIASGVVLREGDAVADAVEPGEDGD